MIDRKEIELLIRAQLKGKQDLTTITKSIRDLELAITEQAAAAKRGESSIDDLKATLLGLQQVQDRLASNADLIGRFQRQSDAIGKTAERVERTAKAYEEYQKKLAAADSVTEKQQDRLVKLSVAAERAQTAFDRQKGNIEKLASALREAGVATDDLAGAETRVRDIAAQIGVAIGTAQQAIATYATDVRSARDALREKEQVEKDAIKTARQFAEAEDRAADAERRRAENAAEVDRILSERKARSAAQGNEFQALAEESARARTLAELKADIIARSEEQLKIEKELAKTDALGKTADEAVTAARAYGTLGRASDDLRNKGASLRDTIAGIVNPAQGARRSIEGIEQELAQLATGIRLIDGPVQEANGKFTALAAVSRELGKQATLVDGFRNQVAALRAARAEYVKARDDVRKFADQVRQGGVEGEQATAKLASASARAKVAGQALRQQVEAARASRQALADVGLETNNLAASEKRLTDAARSATSSVESLSRAVNQYGRATEDASKKVRLFGDGGRTTLSLLQRIRGEILALAASYVGLYGAVQLAGDAIQAASAREGIKNQLSLSVGNNREAIDAEYAYVKAQSDRIGIEFETAAQGYTKFAAAAALAGRKRTEIRYIWEAFAEVGRVANLSAADMQGVFKAIEQITSKGKIQAEELRGQLGDRLFGAFQVAAKALEDQFPNLDKAMERGEVSANQLIAIALKYREIVGAQLPAAINSTSAAQARFANAVLDFKLAIADSGWLETYTETIGKLTEFLRSDDGQRTAQNISRAFEAFGSLVIFLLDNLEAVKVAAGGAGLALGSIIAATTIRSIGTLVTGLKALRLWAVQAGGALGAFSAQWPILATVVKGAIGVIGSAFLGWQIGTWANEQFAIVRKGAVLLVTGLDEGWTRISYGARILFADLGEFARRGFATMVTAASNGLKGILGTFRDGLLALGNTEAAEGLGRIIDGLTVSFDVQGSKAGELRKQMERDLAQIRAIRKDMLADAEKSLSEAGKSTKRAVNQLGQPTPFPGITPGGKPPAATEKDITARRNLIEEITRSLETLDAKIDRSSNQTLANQLEAVDLQYAALARKIEKVGGDTGKAFMTRLAESTGELKVQITDKFNRDLVRAQEELQNKLEDGEALAGKRSKFELDKRLDAVAKSYADNYRKIADLRETLLRNDLDTTPADLQRDRLDGLVLELQNIERIKFAKEELNRLDGQAIDLIDLRRERIEAVRSALEAGFIDDKAAAEQINRIHAEAIPNIVAAAEATKAWAIAHSAIFKSPEDMDLYIARLDTIINRARTVQTEYTTLEKVAIRSATNAANEGIEKMVDAFADVVSGQKGVVSGFEAIRQSTIGLFKQFFKDIVVAIAKMAFFNALKRSSIPFVSDIGQAGLASVGVFHSGGIVGAGPSRTRVVPSALFANAPRYHSGGFVGLRPDEYAAILRKNEEVLSESNPRNIRNIGAVPEKRGSGQPVVQGPLQVQLHPDAMRMTLRDWFEGELTRSLATR
ncbi:MAG: tape measure protein [Chromatiales bacterium]|nr:tape measure protein [Chromatiales bacterium]